MPKTNTTTVHRDSTGQHKVTIPKALADAMDLNGAKLEWSVSSGSKLEAKVVDQ